MCSLQAYILERSALYDEWSAHLTMFCSKQEMWGFALIVLDILVPYTNVSDISYYSVEVVFQKLLKTHQWATLLHWMTRSFIIILSWFHIHLQQEIITRAPNVFYSETELAQNNFIMNSSVSGIGLQPQCPGVLRVIVAFIKKKNDEFEVSFGCFMSQVETPGFWA